MKHCKIVIEGLYSVIDEKEMDKIEFTNVTLQTILDYWGIHTCIPNRITYNIEVVETK